MSAIAQSYHRKQECKRRPSTSVVNTLVNQLLHQAPKAGQYSAAAGKLQERQSPARGTDSKESTDWIRRTRQNSADLVDMNNTTTLVAIKPAASTVKASFGVQNMSKTSHSSWKADQGKGLISSSQLMVQMRKAQNRAHGEQPKFATNGHAKETVQPLSNTAWPRKEHARPRKARP